MSDGSGLPANLAMLDAPLSPLARVRAAWASPAVVRARPAIFAIIALLVVAGLWMLLRAPDWRPIYADLSEGDKAAVMTALQAGNHAARINPETGAIEVAADGVAAARILLAGQGLPKSAQGIDPVGDMPLGLSRAVESARLKGAVAIELAASIRAIDGVKAATVHIAAPEPSVFVRDKAPASASVFVTLAPGRVLGQAQVRAIVWLVSSSVSGLAADRVSVVDQTGALLSAVMSEGDAAQLGYQARVETMVRERLAKLLTPLLGPGAFTAEVAADMDFSQNEASSERFARDGAVLRSESAMRSSDGNAPAQGIPGALSNTAPPAAQLTATPPAALAAPAAVQNSNESTNRAWEIGKDVSVTRGTTPRLRRLSVAVVIDAASMAKASAADIAAVRRIVQGAAGFDAARGDSVEVQVRRFAVPPPVPELAWYEQPLLREMAPLAGVAVLGLVGGGLWLVRRRKAVVQDGPAVVDGGELGVPPPQLTVIDYSEKLGATRELVSGDADRASAAARQMLATGA